MVAAGLVKRWTVHGERAIAEHGRHTRVFQVSEEGIDAAQVVGFILPREGLQAHEVLQPLI